VIDEIDEGLKAWVRRVFDELAEDKVSLFLGPPQGLAGNNGEKGINLYLLELVEDPPLRTAERPPLQISLRYLVSAWAVEPEAAHRLLGQFAFSAMENPEFQVEFQPLSAAMWEALGTCPRPSFMLRVLLKKPRPALKREFVGQPLVIEAQLTTQLHGVILSPDDTPLPGITVEFPSLQISTRSGMNGRFVFPSVPVEPLTRELLVSGKGHEFKVKVQQNSSEAEPVVIRFDPSGSVH